MSVSFSAGTGLLIAGVFLLLLIIPGFTDIISDLFNRQVRTVWRNSTKYALAISGIFLVFMGLFTILKAEVPESSQIPLPTKTSVATFIPSPFVCGSGAIPTIGTPEPINSAPTLIVILIDETTTKETLETIFSALDSSLQMGDRVIFLISGKDKFNEAVIADETVEISLAFPVLSPSPTPHPTETPAPIQTLASVLQQAAVTMTAQAAATHAAQNSTQYECSVYEWNVSYQTVYSQWKAENQKVVSRSIEFLQHEIQGFSSEKPVANSVFESLRLISNIFATECYDDKYGKCVFVAVASMTDDRTQPPSDIHVNFNEVEVVGTIPDCSLYDQECRDRAGYWENYLSINNAHSVRFVNLGDLWNSLVNAIRR